MGSYHDLAGPTNDLTGFWDSYGRELPCLISVVLHISVGIHAEEELTHFVRFNPPVCTVDVCTHLHTGQKSTVWRKCLGWFKICLCKDPHQSKEEPWYQSAST